MRKEEIHFLIDDIKYPKLDKSIKELNIIESIESSASKITITLALQNDEAFNLISQEIKQKLSEAGNVDIRHNRKQKEMTYGSTQNPNNRAPYAKKVIAVTSGKGGVGKSTTSVNLAISLAQSGYQVGLLDADVYGPDIPRMMDLTDEKMQWSDDDKIIPSENFGIKMMSVGLTTPKRDTPLVWRSSVAVSALIQFLEDVAWGELDFLVIDMPPGTGDIQLTMAQELPIAAAVLVTTPQMVANDDVSRAIMMFKETGVPIGGLIENMSYFIAPDTGTRYDIFGKDGGSTTAIKYDIPFLGGIPLDMQIREMSDEGHPPVAMGSDKHKTAYQGIRDRLLEIIEEK